MITDMLKVNDPEKQGDSKFSQSRVYLFLVMILISTLCLRSLFTEVKNLQIILDTLVTLVFVFAGYALVGKGFKYGELINKKL